MRLGCQAERVGSAPRRSADSQHTRINTGMGRRLSLFSPTGISLIETMIALVVIVVGLSVLRHVFPRNLATGQQALEQVQATLLGKNQLEQLRLRGFPALATLRFATTPESFVDSQQQVVDGPFRWQAEVYHEAEDLLAVHIRVVWPWPAQTHQVRLATYVSRH
jgi:type II secretory pathway pseudopilin PulG